MRGAVPVVPLGKVMTRSRDTLVESATLALQNRDVFVKTPLGLKVVGAHATAPGALTSPLAHSVQAVELPMEGLYVFAGHCCLGAPPGQ